MEQESTSFSADIKKFEEALAKDPMSFCFAPLSDLYRKDGLLDEAINVAKNGCEVHPGYVGGFMALGRACYEKGDKVGSMAALEKVIQVTPDNHLAQKLLSRLYMETGDTASAVKSLQVMLSANPSDVESQMLLDSLQADDVESIDTPPVLAGDDSFFSADTSEIMGESTLEYELALDDVEIIEELEELTEEFAETEDKDAPAQLDASCVSEEAVRKDPLKTATLAELYVSQGVLTSALSIYQELLEIEPSNLEFKKRVAEIQQVLTAEEVTEDYPGGVVSQAGESHDTFSQPESVSAICDTDNVAKLEQWLENIKRGR